MTVSTVPLGHESWCGIYSAGGRCTCRPMPEPTPISNTLFVDHNFGYISAIEKLAAAIERLAAALERTDE